LGAEIESFVKSGDASKKGILAEKIEEFYNDLNMQLERDMLATMLKLYGERVSGFPVASVVADINSKYERDFEKFVNESFDKSIFKSKESLINFLNNPNQELLDADPIMTLSNDLLMHYRASAVADQSIVEAEEKYNHAFRLMVEGMRQANKKQRFYPDANSTMRLTYGTVRALPADPRNNAPENYFTILADMVAKHKPGDREFDLSQGIMDIYDSKNYGPYIDKNGYMCVNFLTDHDITGGNSGSPVINGKGELIGLAFDGNIEAMAGDVIFDPSLQRTINVDIRFVLLIMDKYAGARNLIEELTLVK
jgi:hypothetical protein